MKKNMPKTSSSTTDPHPGPGVATLASNANVDLTVTGPGFSKTSNSTVNNTEIVDIPNPVAGGTYTVTVRLNANSSQNVPFGIAWR